MRHVLAIGGLIFICVIVVPGFWLARKSKAALSPGILSAQVDKLASGWKAQDTPESDRVINLIISDAEAATAEESKTSEKPSGYSSEDLEVLSSVRKPSAMARLGTWFHRTFFRRSMSAGEDTVFMESFAGKPNVATWTHKGEETASEEEMTREFMKAILKADDAKATVNIITDGAAAAAVLKAVKILKNVKRPGGHIPTVSKFIAVNMNRATLARRDFNFSSFSKPDNLRELMFVWNPPANPKKTTMEVFSPKYNGKRFDGGDLFPMMGGGGPDAQNVIRLIEVMAKKIYAIEAVVGRLEAKAEEKKLAEAPKQEAAPKEGWKAKPVSRDLMGRTYSKEPEQPAQPADSLSAISIGNLKGMAGNAETGIKDVTLNRNGPAQTQIKQVDKQKGIAGKGSERPQHRNWYDARAYCGGSLPSVAQLKSVYYSECKGGKHSAICTTSYWSDESTSADFAKSVSLSNGRVMSRRKSYSAGVRCQ